VRVRILLDDFNSVGEDAQVLRLAFDPTSKCACSTAAGLRSQHDRDASSLAARLRPHAERMHNKLFIADNAWGITGGATSGDATSAAATSRLRRPRRAAAGRIVRDMSASFDRFWNDELAYPVQTLLDQKDIEACATPIPARLLPASGPPLPASPHRLPAQSLSHHLQPPVLPESARPEGEPGRSPRARPAARVPLFWAPATLLVDQPGKVGPATTKWMRARPSSMASCR
jgi:phosphatidylserine/phosphatidylglycerophosphate/cardiolipin synthase-like enzyme